MEKQPLAKSYSPQEQETAVTKRWDEADVFAAPATLGDKHTDSFSVVIPPPNVTAALHLGHALNNTLQDVLVRYNRMLGRATLWMPGTDHAGIATQTVVEKRLLAAGTKRLDMGREAFIEKTQEWKDEYEAIILDQLKAMGASCDWDRTRFTMDDMCSVAVRHAFYTLFKDGLIYRGKRLVNWDPATQTALADDEVEMEEVAGHMWYLDYPLSDGSGHITVATTRPETMLGDTAVAINPNDPRAEALRGKTIIVPIVGREIPIVEDDYVIMADAESSDTKAQYASGFLKVTPAHDVNDYDIGQRHDLPIINVMGPDGAISASHGWEDVSDEAQAFVGLSREDARDAIVAWFDKNNLLAEVRDYTHSVGHSYRSHVSIEPWLSDQWYVAVTDDRLRGAAMRAQNVDQLPDDAQDNRGGNAVGDGELTFYPPRYARTFRSWHEGLRDWCISRQLWWGHQIPVWTKTYTSDIELGDGYVAAQNSRWESSGAVHMLRRVSDTEVEEAVCLPPQATLDRLDRSDASSDEVGLIKALEAEGFVRDPDVLDTWFSSALWPLSTMGWPYPQDFSDTVGLLETYKPTSVLSTAREIITLWVSRMTMFNRYFADGQLPFSDVFIHAMVQDGHGQKMSKSLGNGVDPRDITFSHGTDAMRFALTQMTTDTQDVRMPVDLVCPHSGEAFTPEYITTAAGHVVAAPTQVSPSDESKKMVTAYGVAAGLVEPSEEMPLARNTSPKFDAGRNFANKVWNATRFALSRIDATETLPVEVDVTNARFADRWIIARLHATLASLDAAYANYQFHTIAETVYDFIWHDVCDRYLEAVKPTIDDDLSQQVILRSVLDSVLRVLHPICPFVTEVLWPHVEEVRVGEVKGVVLPASALAAQASWPRVDETIVDSDVIARFDRLEVLISQVRALRAQLNVKPKQKVTLHVTKEVASLIAAGDGLLETLAGVGSVETGTQQRPQGASSLAFEGSEVLVSDLVETLDVAAEQQRLAKVIAATEKQIANLQGRLANENYVSKAKPALVQDTRDSLVVAEKDLAAAQASLEALK